MSESMETAVVQQSSAGPLDSIWELEVKFDAGASARSRTLFGNGRMQVRVQVLISGSDKNGNVVPIPSAVLDTVELVHYSNGKTLQDGWKASTEQGRFTLEAPLSSSAEDTLVDDNAADSSQSHVRTFWVSSSGVG